MGTRAAFLHLVPRPSFPKGGTGNQHQKRRYVEPLVPRASFRLKRKGGQVDLKSAFFIRFTGTLFD